MRSRPSTFRSWLAPLALIAIAAAMTVPWSYWVIKAAYDRDVVDNAISLARRVELRLASAPRSSAGLQVSDALKTELQGDRTVQEAVFVDLSSYPLVNAWWTGPNGQTPRLSLEKPDLERIVSSGVQVKDADGKIAITVPWIQGNRAAGFTYLELSSQALHDQFWQKEGTLVTRVAWLTVAALAVLSAVAIYAYGTWRKVARVERRAELARQGLLAERGLTAAVLAHEIRNPLAALRFQLHSLRKNAASTDRVATTADTIDAELSRIQQLVTDYLEHEKARTMRVQPVDLEDAARGLQVLMGELFRQTNTELVVEAPPAAVHVVCDPHALRQVLMNLVLNAQQAMGHGGRITLTIGRDETSGTVDVADNGPGIPPEMRDQLFKPFQTNKRDGHGIGLALVKRFVDNFGGSVTVDSQPGRGTTFRLRLPVHGSDDAQTATPDDELQYPVAAARARGSESRAPQGK